MSTERIFDPRKFLDIVFLKVFSKPDSELWEVFLERESKSCETDFITRHVFVQIRETMLTAILIDFSYPKQQLSPKCHYLSKSFKMCVLLPCRNRLKVLNLSNTLASTKSCVRYLEPSWPPFCGKVRSSWSSSNARNKTLPRGSHCELQKYYRRSSATILSFKKHT